MRQFIRIILFNATKSEKFKNLGCQKVYVSQTMSGGEIMKWEEPALISPKDVNPPPNCLPWVQYLHDRPCDYLPI
ncbi:MAG: hypothetical protein AYK18_02600 [Theionarchaea archaeon DG-70]|nr:MAG: hypothetical protein AYK18_02600 [Theionarchaea archaeon DG-70]